MHKRDIVHRDLKPDNLILKTDNLESTTIVDFGLSVKYENKPLSDIGFKEKVGTMIYMAPELM